jgi:hypothetical protein
LAFKSGRTDHDLDTTLSHGLALRMDADYEPIGKTTDQRAAEYVDRAEHSLQDQIPLIACAVRTANRGTTVSHSGNTVPVPALPA